MTWVVMNEAKIVKDSVTGKHGILCEHGVCEISESSPQPVGTWEACDVQVDRDAIAEVHAVGCYKNAQSHMACLDIAFEVHGVPTGWIQDVYLGIKLPVGMQVIGQPRTDCDLPGNVSVYDVTAKLRVTYDNELYMTASHFNKEYAAHLVFAYREELNESDSTDGRVL